MTDYWRHGHTLSFPLCLYYSIQNCFSTFAPDIQSELLLAVHRTCHIIYLSPAQNMFTFIFTFRSHFRYLYHVITSRQQLDQIWLVNSDIILSLDSLCILLWSRRGEYWGLVNKNLRDHDHVGRKQDTDSGLSCQSCMFFYPPRTPSHAMTITTLLLLLFIELTVLTHTPQEVLVRLM